MRVPSGAPAAEVMSDMAVLARCDFLRAPVLATARPEGYKEWHHFAVHRPGWRLLVNFSLTNEPLPDRPLRLVPRVIVIIHQERWSGVVERFTDANLHVSADLGSVTVGRHSMRIRPDGYRITIDSPDRGIGGELHLTPVSRPFVVTNQPAGTGRLSWLLVPRLRATGWFRAGGVEHRLTDEPAYHDHNWGRFRWGEDFGWEWSSILPSNSGDPWSLVFTRVTDRRRLHSFYQALFVWRHHELVAVYRDAAVRAHSHGLLARPPDCTLPPPMRLVLGGEACDVPESVEITGTRSGETVRAEFRPVSYARLAQPSEVDLDRSVVLCETSGTAYVRGVVDGEELDFTGDGVFEWLHG
ncbi:MAG: hypothetical protein JWO67_3325 [Streptosporangiaceae bacterium]|nr:hypothetical protein [Streptosporangiaceae bacterium]